ncbi:hypothetical protein T492DRAFT_1151675 [Pavlovales sp. CCMP2436]|nr:hypothetical protein T492DRAFT_1151675 [Pavlovales sp. CCMP2436]
MLEPLFPQLVPQLPKLKITFGSMQCFYGSQSLKAPNSPCCSIAARRHDALCNSSRVGAKLEGAKCPNLTALVRLGLEDGFRQQRLQGDCEAKARRREAPRRGLRPDPSHRRRVTTTRPAMILAPTHSSFKEGKVVARGSTALSVFVFDI